MRRRSPTRGKRFFPFGGATQFFAQVNARMAGPNSGSWSAIWTLPDVGGTGQEIDVQEYNVSGPDPGKMYSHVQAPAVLVGTGTSAAPLSAGYHVYGWSVDVPAQTLTTYLDGVETGTYTGPQVGSKYFIILDAAVSSGEQGWQSSEGFATNSNADMAMSVAEIQVYQQ
jgi:beta-glucanase (GH16 family)